MRRMFKWLMPGVVAAGLMTPTSPVTAAEPRFEALVFSKTAGYRHDECIGSGTAAIKALGAARNFTVDATEDASAFTDANLAKYDVVIWLCTTGDVLDNAQQGAFERYIAAGGGYTGIHSASDTEYDWPWYGGLVGAYFLDHPLYYPPLAYSQSIQVAAVDVLGHASPANAALPDRWVREEEWYNFRTNAGDTARVLAEVDESTYDPSGWVSKGMGDPHPISWCQNYEGGRAFYTAVGHGSAAYAEPLVLAHLLGGIEMTAGAAPFNCTTYHEVSELIAELQDDDRLSTAAARSLLDRLEKARTRAAAGNEAHAMRYLEQFIARAENQVKGDADDRAVRDLLVRKAQELIAWEQDLDTQENARR